jgi:hypothetical protein
VDEARIAKSFVVAIRLRRAVIHQAMVEILLVDYAALIHPTDTSEIDGAQKTAGHLSVTRRCCARLIVRF